MPPTHSPSLSGATRRRHARLDATSVALMAIAAAAYLVVPLLVPRVSPGSATPLPNWYCRLADALLHGHLDILTMDPAPRELIPSGQPYRWYVGYPPVPSLLLMPFVAWLGPGTPVKWFVRLLSVLNVAAFDWMVRGAADKLGIGRLRPGTRLAYGLLFALGSMAWHVAIVGGDWHLAHVVGTGCVLLALGEYFGRRRFWLIGAFVALAAGSRPPAGLGSAAFFAVAILLSSRESGGTLRGTLRALAGLAIGPVAIVVALGVYNWLRFGSAGDFGYERMILDTDYKRSLEAHGVFSRHFIRQNLYWFFIATPDRLPSFPWLAVNGKGLGLLWTMPAVLFAFAARSRPATIAACWAGIAVALVPLVTYYNTGAEQFGHRFGMDYLPMLLVLILIAAGRRPSLLAHVLVGVSIAVEAYGAFLWLSCVG